MGETNLGGKMGNSKRNLYLYYWYSNGEIIALCFYGRIGWLKFQSFIKKSNILSQIDKKDLKLIIEDPSKI